MDYGQLIEKPFIINQVTHNSNWTAFYVKIVTYQRLTNIVFLLTYTADKEIMTSWLPMLLRWLKSRISLSDEISEYLW